MQFFFRIASRRLNEHEQGLLNQQLKMLKGRTQATWAYLGEDQAGDLFIQRKSDAESEQVTAVLQHVNQPIPMPLEWPLRLFGLLALLEACEQRLLASNPLLPAPLTMGESLSDLKTTTAFFSEHFHCVVAPETDLVHSTYADIEVLIQAFIQHGTQLEKRSISQLPARETLLCTHSLKRVIWALTLKEASVAQRQWPHLGLEFRIGGWPLFNEWETSPVLMRLAALYTRQYASLAQGAEFSQATPADIEAFLLACKRCGLGLDIRQGEAPIQRHAVAESHNLLQRLRFRLGLSIKKV